MELHLVVVNPGLCAYYFKKVFKKKKTCPQKRQLYIIQVTTVGLRSKDPKRKE